MNREIKFRLWNPKRKVMTAGVHLNVLLSTTDNEFVNQFTENKMIWMQYSGLKDKDGKEIYEGDILSYRNPEIGYQTHTGDNIPNGSYTEPTGAILSEKEYEVIFKCGSFQFLDNDGRSMPMQYLFDEQTEEVIELDHETILKQIDLKRNRDIFDDDYSDAQEYLEYLLQELEMTLSTLIDYCKLKVIGNIYENPELL